MFSTWIFPIHSWAFDLGVRTKRDTTKTHRLYFTCPQHIPRPTRFNQHWHLSKGHWSNQSRQVWQWSVKGVQSYGGSNFALLHRNLFVAYRDVTKFEFKFHNVHKSTNVFNRFKIQRMFKRFIAECEFVGKSLFHDWFHMHRERIQTFFLKFNLSHKLQLLSVQHNFCSVLCYTVLI